MSPHATRLPANVWPLRVWSRRAWNSAVNMRNLQWLLISSALTVLLITPMTDILTSMYYMRLQRAYFNSTIIYKGAGRSIQTHNILVFYCSGPMPFASKLLLPATRGAVGRLWWLARRHASPEHIGHGDGDHHIYQVKNGHISSAKRIISYKIIN